MLLKRKNGTRLNKEFLYYGANAYEIGDAWAVSNDGKGNCERDYAIGIYTIPQDVLERALKEPTRLERELHESRF